MRIAPGATRSTENQQTLEPQMRFNEVSFSLTLNRFARLVTPWILTLWVAPGASAH